MELFLIGKPSFVGFYIEPLKNIIECRVFSFSKSYKNEYCTLPGGWKSSSEVAQGFLKVCSFFKLLFNGSSRFLQGK